MRGLYEWVVWRLVGVGGLAVLAIGVVMLVLAALTAWCDGRG